MFQALGLIEMHRMVLKSYFMNATYLLSTLFQELIQNAEDAKATRVCFLLDETQHGTDPNKLANPGLAAHQV